MLRRKWYKWPLYFRLVGFLWEGLPLKCVCLESVPSKAHWWNAQHERMWGYFDAPNIHIFGALTMVNLEENTILHSSGFILLLYYIHCKCTKKGDLGSLLWHRLVYSLQLDTLTSAFLYGYFQKNFFFLFYFHHPSNI